MFDRIARVYDRMNALMTVGMHHRWRERAADLARVGPGIARARRGHRHRRPGDGAAGPRGARSWGWTSPSGCSSWRAPRRPDIRFEAGNALALPYADGEFDAATVGFGARNFSDLAARPRARWRASRARAAAWWCSRSPRRRSRRCRWFFRLWFDRVVPRLGRLAGDSDAYTYLPSSVRRFPGPRGAGGRAGGGRPDGRPLGAHGRRHHRAARRHPRVTAAAGTARGRARRRRARSSPRRSSAPRSAWPRSWPGHGPELEGHAPARSPRAASACGRCSCSSPRPTTRTPRLVSAGGGGGAAPHGHARARRRARPRAAAARPPDRVRRRPAGRPPPRPGDLLFSRAFAELAATGSEEAVSRALGRLVGARARRADAARGRLAGRRGRRALPRALPAEDGEPVRRVLPAGRAVRRDARAIRGARAPSARASAWRSSCSTTCSTCPGPAERTGKPRGTDLLDGTVTLPLILARRRDPELRATRPARGRHGRRAGGAAVRPDRRHRRARRGAHAWRSSTCDAAKARLRPARPARRPGTGARLVADGVVERYAVSRTTSLAAATA